MSMDHTAYKKEQLEYFKELIEGRATVSWRAWWNSNDAILKSQLKRPEYARLKFKRVKYAHEIIEANGIKVEWGAPAKRESYYANLCESVLDEKGRPEETFRRNAYNGASGDFIDGKFEKAREKLTKIISKLKKKGSLKAREELEDMQFDGEMMVTDEVDEEFGKALLKAVVSYGYGDDLTDFVVDRADEILKKFENA